MPQRPAHLFISGQEAIEQVSARLTEELLALEFPDLMDSSPLSCLTPAGQRVGSKPLLTVADRTGNRFVLKVADPALMAAEEAAHEIRRLGGRPSVPARKVRVDVEGYGRVTGLLKPYLEFDPGAELQTDTSCWSELQRSVILLEHAWEWFLDNLDTNTSQYALLGPEKFPVNFDWDRAFSTEGRSELSRFAKYKHTLPNARTFLYADYVEGRITLQTALLLLEARRIHKLPTLEVLEALKRYARVRYTDETEAREFVRRILRRKHRIEHEVTSFLSKLERERRELTGLTEPQSRPRARRVVIKAWDRWQRLLNGVLRGPFGNSARRVLKALRGRRLGIRLRAAPQPRRLRYRGQP